MGFPKIRGTLIGVPILRTIILGGSILGSLILGNYRVCRDPIVVLGLRRDNGKENGNYYNGLYRDYIGYILGLYRGYRGIMEKKMEATI